MNEWNRLHDCCHADQEVVSVATFDPSANFLFHFTGINLIFGDDINLIFGDDINFCFFNLLIYTA
jgi:hypothetical protein